MKAAVIFTGSGPILILTTYGSVENVNFVEKLRQKGVEKFIAYEVPIDRCREMYGNHYNVILEDVHQSDDFRVLDYNGHRVFRSFHFRELDRPFVYEPEEAGATVVV